MKMLFRLNGGGHVQNGKAYKKGDIIRTSLNLNRMFGSKFVRVHEDLDDTGTTDTSGFKKPQIPPPVVDKKAAKEPEPVEDAEELNDVDVEEVEEVEEKEEAEEKEQPEGKHGKDVSSEFETAKTIEVSVFEKKNWFTVVDKQDGAVLNDKKLRRKAVEPFLKQYVESPVDVED